MVNLLDGKWQQSSDKGTYEVINPANEEVLGHASKATAKDVDAALQSAAKGLEIWKKTAPWQRSYIIRKNCRQDERETRSTCKMDDT